MKLQLSLGIENVSHLGDLLLTLLLNLHVLSLNDILLNEDSILVISSNRQLGHLNLSLLQVDNDFEVELELLGSVFNLFALAINHIELVLETVQITAEEVKVVLELVKPLVVGVTSLLQFNTGLSLRHVLEELSLGDVGGAIALKDVDFFLFLNFNFGVNLVLVDLGEGVIFDNTAHSVLAGFLRHLNSGLRESLDHEIKHFTDSESLLTGERLHSLLVLLNGLVTAEDLFLLSGVVLTVQKVSLLVLELREHVFALFPELNLVDVGLTLLVEHDNHTHDVKFLLVNTGLVEEPLLV